MAAPVEAKVKAASAATFLVGIAIAVLNAIVADSSLLGPLPSWAQAPLLALAPAALAWLAGYRAKHTVRDVADPTQGR
ncbi:holin [Streptomyces sp. NBC_00378]|uniref:holin n=1 Tax=unclassified Streptomyces TaxID=2593676 RepID=UPI002258D099|nr:MULTISPECIES: holin [unclassified Streptomyces]MCX5114586.1 holin [Streptomyces sp. NBC_00378]